MDPYQKGLFDSIVPAPSSEADDALGVNNRREEFIRIYQPAAPPVDLPPRVRRSGGKRIAITSYEAYMRIMPTLPDRDVEILGGLDNYTRAFGSPTAYELFKFMQARDATVFDINNVRPRLTKLKDQRLVQFGERRICSVTHFPAYTWIFPEVVQDALFKETDE